MSVLIFYLIGILSVVSFDGLLAHVLVHCIADSSFIGLASVLLLRDLKNDVILFCWCRALESHLCWRALWDEIFFPGDRVRNEDAWDCLISVVMFSFWLAGECLLSKEKKRKENKRKEKKEEMIYWLFFTYFILTLNYSSQMRTNFSSCYCAFCFSNQLWGFYLPRSVFLYYIVILVAEQRSTTVF